MIPVDGAASIAASLLGESRQNKESEREVAVLPENETDIGKSGLVEVEAVRAQFFRFSPYDFEHFIKALLERNGFVRVSVTRASGDGGIDVNAYVDERSDFFAGTHVQAQVKRWRHAVGSPEINSFRGALSSTAKGVFVTTSHFTRAAAAEARGEAKPSITLLDGERLADVVIRSGIAANTK